MNFYVRRARRILPALLLVMAVCFPFAWFWMLPAQFKDFAQSVGAISVFSSNVLFWKESGYFALDAELKPLLHTWSLAVEEQFYIFFPLLMIFTLRRGGWRPAILAISVIGVASLTLSEVLWRLSPDANFYLLPSRAWELLVGSFCAVVILRARPKPNALLALAGFVVLTATIFLFDGSLPFPSLWALIPVAGTALIILYCDGTGVTGWILTSRPAVGVGLISYSAYLWHQPLLAFARLRLAHEPETWMVLTLSLLSLALGWLSWRYVERPFRRPVGTQTQVLGTAAAICILGVAVGGALSVSGVQSRWFMASVSPENQTVLRNIDRMQTLDHSKLLDDGACRFVVHPDRAEDLARFDACAAANGKALVIFGDSHSQDIYQGLSQALDRPFVVHVPQDACRPHIPGSPCKGSPLATFLTGRAAEIEQAIYTQAGFWLLQSDISHERAIFLTGDAPRADPNPRKIRMVADFLEGLALPYPVTWLGPRIEPHIPLVNLLARDCRDAPALLHLRPEHRDIFARLDAAISQELASRPIVYASIINLVDFDEAKDVYTCDDLYWSDGDHWSPKGELRFGARLAAGLFKTVPTN